MAAWGLAPLCCCRLYLSPYDLTPTYKDVHNKFSVRYFLNLVLVDEEDRRYFKQQEITLYRLEDTRLAPPGLPPRPLSTSGIAAPAPGEMDGGGSSSGAVQATSAENGGAAAEPGLPAVPEEEYGPTFGKPL